jgi:hypothetical protein
LDLRIAVIGAAAYGPLLDALKEAGVRLRKAAVGFDTDRQVLLRQAREQLEIKMSAISASAESFD